MKVTVLFTKDIFSKYSLCLVHHSTIEGLETSDYLDNLSKWELLTEQADAKTFEFEMDQAYLGSPNVIAVLAHEWKRTYVNGKKDFQTRFMKTMGKKIKNHGEFWGR
ncbi:hypothetical protein N665_0047s0035 [Sinapis alba]|nr:hypothetical protein N665_0047s0035 [Sinapis alba]KAF8113629.1 hypothetical protein N665_0047s0035 [Sinapis alba]